MTELDTPEVPFSNGTEGEAWMGVWCEYCVHDHGMHIDTGPGCDLILSAMARVNPDGSEPWRWPEAWTPEPPGEHHLPSLMLCGMFTPCTKDNCTDAPEADNRANVIAYVKSKYKPTPTTKDTP